MFCQNSLMVHRQYKMLFPHTEPTHHALVTDPYIKNKGRRGGRSKMKTKEDKKTIGEI